MEATPTDLVDETSHEIGPALLMPDGRTFWVGGSGATAFYDPPTATGGDYHWNRRPGPLINGPVAPNPYRALDAPGCLLPNGHVLFLAGHPVDTSDGAAGDPTFFEFDGNSITSLGLSPFNAAQNFTYRYRMLVLPTGEVLISYAHGDLWVFQPDGTPEDSWRPTITHVETDLRPGRVYQLTGTQLNGLSQAVSYGDDYQAATNYPLVRLEYEGDTQGAAPSRQRVVYCRTAEHSTMGVATGTAPVSTFLMVPDDAPTGPCNLVVVANGIPSAPVAAHVGPGQLMRVQALSRSQDSVELFAVGDAG